MIRPRDWIKLAVAVSLMALAVVLWREQPPPPRPRPLPAPRPRPGLAERYGGMWHPAKAEDRRAAIQSIAAQLDAFRRDDYVRAVAYQSTRLQGRFDSTEAFRRMMRLTYPQFTDFQKVQYGPGRWDFMDERLTIPVAVTGRDGVTVTADYAMIREDGVFRVDGVAGGLAPEVEGIESL
jgi:Domain of unknown function (DUF4864)